MQDKPIVSPILVGRTREFEVLERALKAAQAGNGQCLLIAGEAGVGKTRLLAEVQQNAAAQGAGILQGNCFEQDVAYPYAPWIDMLRAYFMPRTTEQVRAMLGPLAVEFVALLPELAPSVLESPSISAADAESEKRRRFESLVRFFAQQSQKQPLLIVVEDLHWSDETSLELFHLCARRFRGNRILLVGTYRREDHSPHLARLLARLNRERNIHEVILDRLAREPVATMVRAIFEIDRPIGRDFLDVMMALSEGNPFFVEEILKALVEQGDIAYREGKWERRTAANLRVPSSVQDAVQQRIASLDHLARPILRLAAVTGQRFDFGLLQATAGLDENTVLEAIKALVAAQLIVEQAPDQFAFRHALTREAAYATLLGHERRDLHRRIGDTLERRYPDPVGCAAHIGELAYHYYHAAVWDKALVYSQRAGERAQTLFAPREALDHFTHALDSAHQLSVAPPIDLLRARAKAHETLGNYNQARSDLEAALKSAQDAKDRRVEWQVTLDLGFLWAEHDYAQSGAYLLRALDTARQIGDPVVVAKSLNRVGNWHLNRDDPTEAQQFHRQALAVFRELGDEQGVAETLELLSVTSYVGANVVEGIRYSEEAITRFRHAAHRQGLIQSLIHLTLRAQFDTEVSPPGDIAQLIHPAEEALRLAREMDWRTGEATVMVNLAHGLIPAGEYERALDVLASAQSIGEEINHQIVIMVSHWLLGQVYNGLLAFSNAQRHLEQAIAMAEASNSVLYTRVSAADLALTYVFQNELERARALLSTSLDGGPTRSRHLRACWTARAELALSEGDPTYALQIVEDLLASASNIDRYGLRGIPRIAELRGNALAALGRSNEAEAALLDARAGAQEQGRRPLLWRIRARLGNLYRMQDRRSEAEQEFAGARALIHELAAPLSDEALRNTFLRAALTILPAAPVLTPRLAAKQAFGGLTAREREVAALVARGKSNAEIAEELVTSKRTVEKHVGSILSKLGLNSRTQVVAWVIEKGLDQ